MCVFVAVEGEDDFGGFELGVVHDGGEPVVVFAFGAFDGFDEGLDGLLEFVLGDAFLGDLVGDFAGDLLDIGDFVWFGGAKGHEVAEVVEVGGALEAGAGGVGGAEFFANFFAEVVGDDVGEDVEAAQFVLVVAHGVDLPEGDGVAFGDLAGIGEGL